MTAIKKLIDGNGNQYFPQTHTKAVVDDNGYSVESRMQAVQDEVNQAQMEIGAVPSDLAPTENSTNWVTSGGVYNAVQPQNISYDNSQSGLVAENVQGALDEVSNLNFVEENSIETGNRIAYRLDDNGVWTSQSTTHKVVPVKGGEKYKIVASNELPAVYRFLISDTVSANERAQLSVIDGTKHLISAGEYDIVTIPSDTHFLYFQGTMGTDNYSPADLVKIDSLKDIVENNTSDILENIYSKAIDRRMYDITGSGLNLSFHGLSLTVGDKYKIKMSFSLAPSTYMGVRLYAGASSSSDNISIGIVPAGVTEYELIYSPDGNTNYQYLGISSYAQDNMVVDVKIYSMRDIADKFNDIDSAIYLEYPLEQGTIALDGEALVNSNIELRSSDFIKISKPVTLTTNTRYVIHRVFAYNDDGTLNSILNRETTPATSFELTDIMLIYKITIGKDNGGVISPSEECLVGTPIKEALYDLMGKSLQTYNAAQRIVYVAAYDSTAAAKKIANYVCDGVNDEVEIQDAINSLPYGGTVQLLDGRYNIDAFPQTIDYGDGRINHIAIFIAGNANRCRSLLIKGTTENKGYHSRYGAHIHVSSSAIAEMNDTDTYTCIMGSGIRPSWWGDYTFSNNVNFENFFIYIGDGEKKMVGIDCTHFGGTHMEHVCIYTESYMEKRFAHQKPPTPVEGSIGIITNCGSNDAIDCGFYYIDCSGMYIGLMTQDAQTTAIDHLVIIGGCFCRCVYGLYFQTGSPKTMTLINCCEEGCTHLPYFGNSIEVATANHITMIDFNVERFNNNYYPDDPTGNTEFYAVEQTPGQWIGTIEFTLQGWSGADTGNAGQHFWKNDGSGRGVRTRNLNEDHTGYSRPNCGEYLEQYFDTTNNVWKTWNGSSWV